MKIEKFFSVLLGALGIAILVFTLVLCLVSLDAETVLLTPPGEALGRAEAMMDAVAAGDYAAAGQLMYGKPDLGVDREPADAVGKLVWDAFIGSISYEFVGDCYATDSGISQNVSVTALDITSLMGNLKTRVNTLLNERIAQATEMSQLYDEENNFREDMVEEVLQEAVTAALAEDAQNVTREVTLSIAYREGQWWVVPDAALLSAISGGVA